MHLKNKKERKKSFLVVFDVYIWWNCIRHYGCLLIINFSTLIVAIPTVFQNHLYYYYIITLSSVWILSYAVCGESIPCDLCPLLPPFSLNNGKTTASCRIYIFVGIWHQCIFCSTGWKANHRSILMRSF